MTVEISAPQMSGISYDIADIINRLDILESRFNAAGDLVLPPGSGIHISTNEHKFYVQVDEGGVLVVSEIL